MEKDAEGGTSDWGSRNKVAVPEGVAGSPPYKGDY